MRDQLTKKQMTFKELSVMGNIPYCYIKQWFYDFKCVHPSYVNVVCNVLELEPKHIRPDKFDENNQPW